MQGTIHEIYTTDRKGKLGVSVCNQENSYYECLFETRQEVDGFIVKLEKARDEVFGGKKVKEK